MKQIARDYDFAFVAWLRNLLRHVGSSRTRTEGECNRTKYIFGKVSDSGRFPASWRGPLSFYAIVKPEGCYLSTTTRFAVKTACSPCLPTICLLDVSHIG